VNQAALGEAVRKGIVDLPQEMLRAICQGSNAIKPEPPAEPKSAAVTPLNEVYRAIEQSLTAFDFGKLGVNCLEETIELARGRV
jgi:hypothetical protein